MSDGRFRSAIDAERSVFVQRGRRTLERRDGHGQRGGRPDGQPERVPLAGQDVVAAVSHDLPGPVHSVGGSQQPGHNPHDRRAAEGLAEALLHHA